MRYLFRVLALNCLVLLLVACSEKTTEHYLVRGEAFLDQKKYDAAILDFKSALQKDSKSAKARWLLGKVYMDIGDVLSAGKELQRAQELGWQARDISPLLAASLIAQGEYVKVSEINTRELKGEAKGAVLAQQALAAFALGKTERARRLMDGAVKTAPDSLQIKMANASLLAREQRVDSALELLAKTLEQNPEYGPAWSLQGDVHLHQGELELAQADYSKAIEFKRVALNERLQRGLIRLQMQDYPGAEEDASFLLSVVPQHGGSNYLQGLILFQKKDYELAAAAFALAEPSYKQYPMVLFYLASTYVTQADFDKARSFADRFFVIAPEHIAGRKLLAAIRLNDRNFSGVRELIAPVLERVPNDVGALNLMANAHLGQGQADKGIALLTKIVEIDPDSPVAKVRLGAGLLVGGQSETATQHIESALELNPEFQQAEILLVLNHLNRKDFDKAIEAAESFRRRNLLSTTPYNLLGRVHQLAGNSDLAKEAIEGALKRDAGDPGANHSLAQMDISAGDLKSARERYMAVLSSDENNLAAVMELAKIDAREQKLKELENRLSAAIAAHPNELQPRLFLGRLYMSQRAPEKVAAVFVSLDVSLQQSPAVLQLLALSQLSNNEHEKAQFTLEQMTEAGQETAASHHLMAMALAGSNDTKKTRQELERAIELDPNYAPSLLALAKLSLADESSKEFAQYLSKLQSIVPESADLYQLQALDAGRRGDVEAALDLSRKAFEKIPTTQSLLMLASYLEITSEVEEAVKLRNDWLEKNPRDLIVHLAVADRFLQLEQVERSMMQYRKVLDFAPDNPVALNNLSWHLRQSNPSEALSYAERAVELLPEAAEIMDTLAVVQLFNKDYVKAKRSIQKALRKMPENPSLQYHSAMIDAESGDSESAEAKLAKLLETELPFPERDEAVSLYKRLKD